MTTRTKLQTITLSIVAFALLSLPFTTLKAQVSPGNPGTVQPLAKGIKDIKIGLGKQPSGEIMRFYVGSDGNINLGQLEEGTYTLTFSLAPVPPPCTTCKTYFESRSNLKTAAVIITGAKSGPIAIIIDFERNVMFNSRSMSFEPLGKIVFEVTGYDVLTGQVTSVPPTTPNSN